LRHTAAAIERVHRNRFQFGAAPIGSSDAVAGDSAAADRDQEKFRTDPPILEEQLGWPSVLAERSALDCEDAIQIAPGKSADFYADHMD
jgi:hypothetical protein